MVKGGGAGHGAGRFALPDRRPRHRTLRLPFPRSAGLHTLPVLRVPHLHRCAQRPAVPAAGWPCGPWHLDLCVLPWALHPVLRSDVLPEGAAIQTEQLRNPAASNLNSTPFVRQYDILSNKWGVLLCQKEYQTSDIRRSSREWL